MCASISPKSNNQYSARTSVPIFPTHDEHRSTYFAEQGAARAHGSGHEETTIGGSELVARHGVHGHDQVQSERSAEGDAREARS
jgi:hypothetical protein